MNDGEEYPSDDEAAERAYLDDLTERIMGRIRAEQLDTERVGVSVALGYAATEADVDAIMEQTHDKLIADLGARRRSGVLWDLVRGRARIRRELRRLGVDTERGEIDQRVDDEPQGVLVIAFAEALQ